MTEDITGKVFEKWLALDQYVVGKDRHRKRLCECECGTLRYVSETALRRGKSTSCGCDRAEKIKEAMEDRTKISLWQLVEISSRAKFILEKNNIRTLGDLSKCHYCHLKNIPGIGDKTIADSIKVLKKYGLSNSRLIRCR